MKIKSGFVSNSSTCSFILAGWPVFETDEELAELFGVKEEDCYDIWEELFNSGKYPIHSYSDRGNFVGVELARWSDDSGDLDIGMTINELVEKLEELKEITRKLGVNNKTAKIYAGIYSC